MTEASDGWLGRSLARFIQDPIATWANDDLLLNEEYREIFKAKEPDVFPVFDWPEFRELFIVFDKRANAAKQSTDRLRIATVTSTTIALVTAAVASILPDAVLEIVGIAALMLTLLSVGLLFYGKFSRYGLDSEWMRNRFRTERLRQLFFQLLLAEFETASAAIDDPIQLAEWRKRRQANLDSFVSEVLTRSDTVRHSMVELVEDKAGAKAWIDPLWGDVSPKFNHRNDRNLLNALFTRRIQCQGKYVLLKTRPSNISTASTRSSIVRTGSALTSGGMLVCAAVLGVLLINGFGFTEPWVQRLLAAEAVGGAFLVGFRIASDALGVISEGTRYGRYEAQIENHERKFLDASSGRDRYEALKGMELSSYREMRDFIDLHSSISPALG